MIHSSYLLLATLGLSSPALGVILPTLQARVSESARSQPVFSNHPCQHGERTCDRNTVYYCNGRGTWTAESLCIFPSWCNENEATSEAWCDEDTTSSAPPELELKKKRTIGIPTPVSTPEPSLTPTRTFKPGSAKKYSFNGNDGKGALLGRQTRCVEGELRCNNDWEELCDAFGTWQHFQQCDACVTNDDGSVNCAPTTATSTAPQPPPTPHTGDRRCSGNTEEIYNEKTHLWEFAEECIECVDNNDGTVSCAPATALPPQPTAPPQCNEGDRRCDGDWFELCNAQRLWDRIQQCSECVNGVDDTFCQPLETETPTPTPSATPSPIPSVASAAGVALDNPCFGGEVRCDNDRISVCSAERQWEDYGPCPNCKQLYNTRVKCDFDNSAQASSAAALFARSEALYSARVEECPKLGFQRCAGPTVEVCDQDGHWAIKEQCTPRQYCMDSSDGIAFCS
ncbi:uncharacterized protein F4822DRAFT_299384 [Hypoxylon trugodes]|uniref:uncharacterized protein n=1 Tax=Hypoxylon trugodes TaxID=326681 RepID=UPI00219E0735|nr:uncharacterized protein F4822DRAFT_299384 [Hypoxylon trugodes]KAI1388005.1 hypothetical protein F4822DRAFT_299384 [Hypoxylon trugodes]